MSADVSERLGLPEHVPSAAVFDFDLYRVRPGYADFHEEINALGAKAPGIFFTPANGGHWVVIDYAALTEMARDTELFSSRPYTIPTYKEEFPMAPLLLDPPEHGGYRRVLTSIFTPTAALAMRDKIRLRAAELIDEVAKKNGCDFVAEVAEAMPVSIFLDLLGLPRSRLHEYRKYAKLGLGGATLQAKNEGWSWIVREMTMEIADRQRQPREDLISQLLAAELNGRGMTADDVRRFCVMLFAAGLDSVTVTMSYGVRHLAQDPALQAQLRGDPAMIGRITEELLRRYSVAQPGRTITRDVEFAGVKFKKGDRILLLVAGADLDPKTFPDPMKVDPGRPKDPHLAFHTGPHRCPGANLARIELKTLYEEWLARIPPFRIDTSIPQTFSGGHVLAIDNVPLRWD